MKRSENADYLEYMHHFARANYVAAREALNRCLLDLRGEAPGQLLEPDRLQQPYSMHGHAVGR